jgi:hypothetical protein
VGHQCSHNKNALYRRVRLAGRQAPFARPGLASVFGFGSFFRFWSLQRAHTREGCGEGEV